MFTLGYTPDTMPCKQDCADRHENCKSDGTCCKWLAYQLTLKPRKQKEIHMTNTGKRSLMKISGGK